MNLEIKNAEPPDLPQVLAILNELSAWGISKGIDMHWPESWPVDKISPKIEAGEMFLAYLDGEPVATLALQWSDEEAWGTQPPDAGYIHHLAVRRTGAGQGIGKKMLDWAAAHAVKRGKQFLRLDCLASNLTLRQYYQDAGFELVGTNNIIHDRGDVCLFEKSLVSKGQAMNLEIKPAQKSDLAKVLAILNENSAWMKQSKGIVGQWPNPWPEDYIAGRVAAGETYLAFVDGQPAGTLTLLWSDEETWGKQPDDAGYVFHLAVRRTFAGQGLGRKLLDWAARTVAAAGKPYLRLDCAAMNPVLRAYYPAAGFNLVDVRTVPFDEGKRPFELALFEKKV